LNWHRTAYHYYPLCVLCLVEGETLEKSLKIYDTALKACCNSQLITQLRPIP